MEKLDYIIYYFPLFIYSLLWLFIFLFYLIKKERNYFFVKFVFWVFLSTLVLTFVAWSFNKYLEFSSTPLGRYYLRPYSNYIYEKITENLYYVFVSVFVSFVFYLAFYFFAQKTNQKIIDAFDVILIGLGLLIIGWPNFLIFLALIFVMAFLVSLIRVISKKQDLSVRVKITPYLPWAFLITLWLGGYLADFIGLDKIRF